MGNAETALAAFILLSLSFFLQAAVGVSLNCTVTPIPHPCNTQIHTLKCTHKLLSCPQTALKAQQIYKQVSAAHGRQFIVAPFAVIHLYRSRSERPRWSKRVQRWCGEADKAPFRSSDVTKKGREMMSWGFPSPWHHVNTNVSLKIVETTLVWLPAFPGSHSEQMISAPVLYRCKKQMTLTTENWTYHRDARPVLHLQWLSLYCSHDFHTAEQENAENVLELKTKVWLSAQENMRRRRWWWINGKSYRIWCRLLISEK